VKEFAFLSDGEQRYLSQIQGRTYANIFGLVERYINAKVLELSQDHWFGDQTALEALVRFSDEELKHQELFRRIEKLAAEGMPPGYRVIPQPDAVAQAVLSKSTWAVLALTLHIELFTQLHYRQSIEPDENLSPLFKDVFLFHWKEESQHAILDELEWVRSDRKISTEARDKAVNEFIELVVAVDGILQLPAEDSRYFAENCGRQLSADKRKELEAGVLLLRPAPAFHQSADEPDHRCTDRAYSVRARDADVGFEPRERGLKPATTCTTKRCCEPRSRGL